MAPRQLEPLAWLLFSAGGVLAALGLPVVVFLFGLAFPLGWLPPPDYAHLAALVRPVPVRLVMWVCSVLALLHWAHRFRYTLYDGLQVKHLNEVINTACYGGALAGAVLAAIVLWSIP
jgi:fumarate reductase subunit D